MIIERGMRKRQEERIGIITLLKRLMKISPVYTFLNLQLRLDLKSHRKEQNIQSVLIDLIQAIIYHSATDMHITESKSSS